MPFLAAWLFGIFTTIAGWVATFIAKKIGFRVIVITAIVTFTGALWAGLIALVNGIATSLPAGDLGNAFKSGLTLLLPGNFWLCLSVCLASDLAAWLYRMKLSVMLAANQ